MYKKKIKRAKKQERKGKRDDEGEEDSDGEEEEEEESDDDLRQGPHKVYSIHLQYLSNTCIFVCNCH